jgi:hypothetical protein
MTSCPTPSPSPTNCYYGKVCPFLKYYSNGNGNFLSNLYPAVYGIYNSTTNQCVYNYSGTRNLDFINSLEIHNPTNTQPIKDSNNSQKYSNKGSTSSINGANIRTWTVNCPTTLCSSSSNSTCW